jgi:hypothetical protein
MAKKAAKPEPVAAEQTSVAHVTEHTAEAVTDPSAVAELVNPNAETVQAAVARGAALIAEGKSKADAAREIFAAIKDESKEVIVAAFVEGATLTPKGALTYWYNCRRKASKAT